MTSVGNIPLTCSTLTLLANIIQNNPRDIYSDGSTNNNQVFRESICSQLIISIHCNVKLCVKQQIHVI